jgi:DNA-binding CsgD family transcriptional regulator
MRPGDRSRARHAAAAAGIDADTAESAAETAGVIETSGNSVRFRHSLIQAAVYHGASDADRRRAHHWLAVASGRDGDPEGQLWHRAAAAAEPDERLAADLEDAAVRAGHRGAVSAAATLLRRSTALTPDRRIRARREVALADAELVTGHPDSAREVAGDALPRLTDPGTRGRAQLVIGGALFAQGRGVEAAEVLADAAAALAADPVGSADALLWALDAAMLAGRAEADKIATIPRPAPAAEPRISDLLLAGYQARFTRGYDAAATPLRAAVRALCADDLGPAAELMWLFGAGFAAAGSLWDDQAMLDISDRWVRAVRSVGAVPMLSLALATRALADSLTGRLDQAADRWAETRELMTASQLRGIFGIDSYSQGLLLAYRGEIAAARAAALAQIRESTARAQAVPADAGKFIVAIADLHAGQNRAAVDAALPVIKDDLPFAAELTLPELIEAAVRSDQRKVAEDAFAILADRTKTAGTSWALGLRARCRALLEEGSAAEAQHAEAIGQLERSRAAVDLARAHLLYGQWLRRAKRRRDARRQLRIAEDMFQVMGAARFAEEAGNELRATGERARTRTPGTELDLTPQEARVANLAASGATNNEIAEQLFLSPSTVDYHLGKVFRKLGVTSRTQLALRLPGPNEARAPAS